MVYQIAYQYWFIRNREYCFFEAFMKKIILVLTVFVAFLVPKNFAMVCDMPGEEFPKEFVAFEFMSEFKFQQLFFLNIEIPLQNSRFSALLDAEIFAKVKKALCLLDENGKNRSYLRWAISALLNAQLFMTYNLFKYSDGRKSLFKEILYNLGWITKKIYKRLGKILPQQEDYANIVETSACPIVTWREINEDILGIDFSLQISLINYYMQGYFLKLSYSKLFLDGVANVFNDMEFSMAIDGNKRMQHDNLQVLSILKEMVANCVSK